MSKFHYIAVICMCAIVQQYGTFMLYFKFRTDAPEAIIWGIGGPTLTTNWGNIVKRDSWVLLNRFHRMDLKDEMN